MTENKHFDSIAEAIAFHAKSSPDKTAVIAGGQSVTYRELFEKILAFASGLRSLGVKNGDTAAIKAAHSIDYVAAVYGAHAAGAVAAPLENSLAPGAFREAAARLGASVIMTDGETTGDMPGFSFSDVLLADTGDRGFSAPERDTPAEILSTTGTTGVSKGVVLSHESLVLIADALREGTKAKEDNVFLVAAPMNHAGGIQKLHMSMLNGSAIVLLPGLTQLKLFFDAIREHGVTSLYLPPSAVRMALLFGAKELAKYDGQIDFVYSGSAPFPEEDKAKLARALPGARLYNGYGGSETGAVSMYDYNERPGKKGCVGRPNRDVDVMIVDESGSEVRADADRPGFIAVKSGMNMLGYLNDPERTARVLRGGRIYTSDLGYFDDEGFLYFAGRAGDVINVGGLKVSPTEVEEAALRYDKISDCALTYADDLLTGKALLLLIVPKAGTEPDKKELLDLLSKSLEGYKLPKQIRTVDSIPRTFNGKIDRKALPRAYKQKKA